MGWPKVATADAAVEGGWLVVAHRHHVRVLAVLVTVGPLRLALCRIAS
jgi:hypothetical protein